MFFQIAALVAFFVAEPVMAAVPNDPGYLYQEPTWNQIHAQGAWDYTVGSKRVVVAVIDTGIDSWHDDLRNNLWTNLQEIPDNGEDDDHNGYVDDINGWNFAENNNDVRPSVFDASDDKEAIRHGTLVSGLIGAVGNNKLDGSGINWDVSLMTLRAIQSNGSGSFQAVAKSVDYAVANGADVISMSFMGETADTQLFDALQRAYQKGVVIVAAAGNYDTPTSTESNDGNLNKRPLYPGCYTQNSGKTDPWMLTVGSVDQNDKLSDFSEYGNCVNIVAPGEYIYSTERYAPQYGFSSQFAGPWFGTSFATPLVAGTAALIKSVHPEWGAKEIIPVILNNTDPVDSLNPGKEGQLGRGRLNVERAVSAAVATPTTRPKGSIFYTVNNSLFRHDLSQNYNKKIAQIVGAVIAVGSEQLYDSEYASVLKKQGSKIYLEVDTPEGEMIANWSIPANIVGEKNAIRFTAGNFFIASSKYNKKTRKTTFTRFSVYDRKTVVKDVAGDIASWGIGTNGNVFTASVNKGALSSGLVKFTPEPSISFKLSNINKVYGVDYSGGNIAILASQKGLVKLFVSNANGLSTAVLGRSTQNRWQLRSYFYGNKLVYFPYAKEGGSFVFYDPDLNPILTQKLSSFP